MVCEEVLFGYKNLWLSRSFLENYGICCCLPGRSCFAYLFCSLVWCHPHWPIIIWGEMGPFYLGGALLRCLVIGFWSVLCGWCATQHCLSHWKTCSLSWDKHCFLFLKMGVVPSLCKILRSLGSKQYQELCAVVCLVTIKWKTKDLWAAVNRELQCCLNICCWWFCIMIF